MILGYFALFLKTTYFDVWEARFWHMPWSDSTPIGPGQPGRRSAPYVGQPCPFTGTVATVSLAMLLMLLPLLLQILSVSVLG